MEGVVCDRCGEGLLIDGDVRYVMSLAIVAAYDPMEITREDLAEDLDEKLKRTIDELDAADPTELERQVHYQAQFDLCAKCQRKILADPLFRSRSPD